MAGSPTPRSSGRPGTSPGQPARIRPTPSSGSCNDLTKDWTQFDDVAAQYPDKLRFLQEQFWVEAAKYQVLPLDDSVATRLITPRPSLTAGKTVFTYYGEVTGIQHGDAPSVLDKSYTITAEVEIPEGGAGGALAGQAYPRLRLSTTKAKAWPAWPPG